MNRWLLRGGLLGIILGLTGSAGSVRADLIAEESFPFNEASPATGGPGLYTASPPGPISSSGPGGLIFGPPQNPASPYFTGGWFGTSTSLMQVQTSGLTYPGQPSSGGAVRFDATSGNHGRRQRRNLTAPPSVIAGEVYWMSGLLHKHTTADNNGGFLLAGFTNGVGLTTSTFDGQGLGGLNDATRLGWRVGFLSDGTNVDLIYRAANPAGNAQVNTVVGDNVGIDQTHLVFVRGVVDGGTGGNDLIQIWLNPADFSTEVSLGAATITLEDGSLGTTGSNPFTMLNHEGMAFFTHGASWDEFRLGTSFLDVAPLATIPPQLAPEPTTLALFALAGMLLLASRLRRR